MRCTVQYGVCLAYLTVLVSPDPAGGCPGRARVVSRRRVLFSFFVKVSQPFIRTYRYIPFSGDVNKKQSRVAGMVGRCLCGHVVRGSNLGWRFFSRVSFLLFLSLFQFKKLYDDD